MVRRGLADVLVWIKFSPLFILFELVVFPYCISEHIASPACVYIGFIGRMYVSVLILIIFVLGTILELFLAS